MGQSKYKKPSLTTDVVLISTDQQGRRYVLLIKRKNPPFKGDWAFPGGFLDYKETVKHGAVRELEEETGVNLDEDEIRLLMIADDPDRDPRGRTISMVYLAECEKSDYEPEASDDAEDTAWFPLDNPPELAFDHEMILGKAREAL